MKRFKLSLAVVTAALLIATSAQTGLAFAVEEESNQELRRVSPIFILS